MVLSGALRFQAHAPVELIFRDALPVRADANLLFLHPQCVAILLYLQLTSKLIHAQCLEHSYLPVLLLSALR